MKKYLICVCFILLSSSLAIAQQSEGDEIFGEKKELVVFPNPAENTVHLLGLKNSPKARIVISNTYGTAVLQYRWEIRNNALSIPIPNLESGIYMITINSKEQQIQTKFYKK